MCDVDVVAMNEENVKIHVLLPYLRDGGVEVQDLSFESSFSIRVGLQPHKVGSKKRRDSIGGRLDILVQRDGVNLLIVEAKREELALTEDDRDQAVSYARLVHPIAPYALVTNGRHFNLYDTITKEQVDLTDARFDGMQVSLPDAHYIEALRTFFRLDSNNLVSFCRQESHHELEKMSGTREDGKKYVRELHVRRAQLGHKIAEFLESDETVLILTGTSGLGKTCELVALTEERLVDEMPTLFFNGGDLQANLTGALSDAFAWHFDSDLSSAGVVRRISSLLDAYRPLLIVVDAIDEWTSATRGSHLSNVAQHLVGQNIKLIASCRAGALETFTFDRDDQTYLGDTATIVDVPPFSAEEFHKAIDKYKRAYDVDVWFEADALELARQSPFFMRILFETTSPGTFARLATDSVGIFEEYLSKITKKTGDPQRAIETIREVAKVLYQSNRDEVSESDVRTALALSPNERLMDALFEQNILVRAPVSVGEANISFYFQQLRNYVIAFKSYRFDQRRDDEAIEEIGSVDFSSMQGEVHRFYYRLANESAKSLYDRRHREQAERYLDACSSMIDRHAPFLRAHLSESDSTAIGFSAEIVLPDRGLGFFGLRSVETGEPRIKFYPIAERSTSSSTYLQGVKVPRLTLTHSPFIEQTDLRAFVLEREVFPSIKQAVKNGRLDERGCTSMLTEQVLGAVFKERREFAELRDSRGRLPECIQLEDVSRCLLKRKLEHRYERELVQNKIESGDIPMSWTETGATYSWSLSNQDRAAIKVQVNANLDSGLQSTDVKAHVDLNRLDETVSLAIGGLQKHGVCEVSTSNWMFLQGAYGPENKENRRRIGEHVVNAHLDALSCYSRIKETNFPLFASAGAPNRTPSPSAFFVLPTAVDPDTPILDIEVMIYFVESEPTGPYATSVDESAVVYDEKSWSLSVHGVSYCLVSSGYRQVRRTLDRHRGPIFSGMPVRTYVYSRLAREIENLQEFVLGPSDT